MKSNCYECAALMRKPVNGSRCELGYPVTVHMSGDRKTVTNVTPIHQCPKPRTSEEMKRAKRYHEVHQL